MPRFALQVEYHGGPFAGWQRQADVPLGAGRHRGGAGPARARRPYHRRRRPHRCGGSCDGTGGPLRPDARLGSFPPERGAELSPEAAAGGDPRLCPGGTTTGTRGSRRWSGAISFRLLVRRAPATFEAGLVWQVKQPLSLQAMRAGAAHLLGHHDFTTFRSSICQAASPVKTLDEIRIEAVEGPVWPRVPLSPARPQLPAQSGPFDRRHPGTGGGRGLGTRGT